MTFTAFSSPTVLTKEPGL